MIRIISLMDNLSSSEKLRAFHGLSVYIETPNHKILFDAGPNPEFIDNAKKLGIDLKTVDTVILSHGHYDHGGGLPAFMKLNENAKFYVRETAFEPHFAKIVCIHKNIGIKASLKSYPNLIYTGDFLKIDEELSLFSGVTERKLSSDASGSLLEKCDGKYIPDRFIHEQYLIVKDGYNQVLFTGCAHAGIVNIIDKFAGEYKETDKVTIVGGFHLYNPTRRKYESPETINAVTEHMEAGGYSCYTGHCTGIKAYNLMKGRMKEKAAYLSVGTEVVIN